MTGEGGPPAGRDLASCSSLFFTASVTCQEGKLPRDGEITVPRLSSFISRDYMAHNPEVLRNMKDVEKKE